MTHIREAEQNLIDIMAAKDAKEEFAKLLEKEIFKEHIKQLMESLLENNDPSAQHMLDKYTSSDDPPLLE